MSIFDKLFGKKVVDSNNTENKMTAPTDQTSRTSEADDQASEAPGWDAIDTALRAIYGEQQPKHWAAVLSPMLGGNDPLQGISAYARETPVRHWHFVTYGFSELYDKESDDLDYSGWGIEMSFRLCVDNFEDQPPTWVFNFLQNLARYVFRSGNVFADGHYMNANGPIALEENTDIRAMAFIEDPELKTLSTPNGRVQFLQIVGLTEDELLALMQWSTHKALEVLQPYLPLYSTNLSRSSLLAKDDIRQSILDGARKEGSNTAYIFVDQLSYEVVTQSQTANSVRVVMGAKQVHDVLAIMPFRLGVGEFFGLFGKSSQVWFKPGAVFSTSVDNDALTVHLTDTLAECIYANLKPIRGVYQFEGANGFCIEVKPTYIRDQEGNVISTIGE